MSFESNNDLFRPPPYCKRPSRPDDEVFEEDTPLLKLEVSDPSKILQLCEDLTERSTKDLEVKINKCLKSQSDASMVFMINLLNVSEEALVQAITGKILEPIIRTQLSEDTINNLVKYKDNCFICPEVMDPKIQGLIHEIVPEDSGEVVVVPILATERRANVPNTPKSGIFPVYLVCFVNPSRDSIFISKLVNETFRYCLTLLLNTRTRGGVEIEKTVPVFIIRGEKTIFASRRPQRSP
ncbi:hypothetical protein NQ318_011068 [Aromia moschata]|uniref:Uncharacterized protein n=1 Tax=Aromia moschata TaxID=1265417 RepID=A0AAV8YSI7_9CUCU|nr:hypothetical protein NQ318_011068 [Aromia moschata]